MEVLWAKNAGNIYVFNISNVFDNILHHVFWTKVLQITLDQLHKVASVAFHGNDNRTLLSVKRIITHIELAFEVNSKILVDFDRAETKYFLSRSKHEFVLKHITSLFL